MQSPQRFRFALRDDLERQVVRVWRSSHRTERTMFQYLAWVRRFHLHCDAAGLPRKEQLTQDGADSFALRYRGPKMRRPAPTRVRGPVRRAVYAWAFALRKLGHDVPEWRPVQHARPLSPLMSEFVAFRQRHRGVGARSIVRDLSCASDFLAHLKSRARSITTAGVIDVDSFVEQLGRRLCKRTVGDTCSALRGFLRFLHATGRTERALASLVIAPRVRRVDRPPRALPWREVRRLLQSVRSRKGPLALRDHAVILLMAGYGLGAAEVVALGLEDLDWAAGTICMRRPKTGIRVVLPLLPDVQSALSAYLRHGRPPQVETRAIFVLKRLPHRALSTSAVRNLIHKRAREAGIRVLVGGHTLRHSHATRQVDGGVNPKVLGDILGHSRPESTSVYVRVALRRLRMVALPVPR